MIEIDGSYGEGGGQIVRTSLALSCITGKPFRVYNIRANRPKPGLAAQHLTGVLAAAEISGASCEGVRKKSKEFTFQPGPVRSGEYSFDIGTAGSISLMLQVIALPLSKAAGVSEVSATGGTHVEWSPTFDYLRYVWATALSGMGIEINLNLTGAGYYPKGGGEVRFSITNADKIKPVSLEERGNLLEVRAISASSNLPDHVRKRQADRTRNRMKKLDVPIDVEEIDRPGIAPGSSVIIVPEFENGLAGFSSLGKPRLKAELVAEKACREFSDFLEGTGAVDKRLADQILLPCALADGQSVYTTTEITQHTLTNAEIIRKFVDVSVEIEGSCGEPGVIRVIPRSIK
ncbi:MAG: RNA 3'-terminal phosphate cyclase [Planctomycetota bacterium]|jgi:RNA 3'-terminal phosphate cyclase (ATP)